MNGCRRVHFEVQVFSSGSSIVEKWNNIKFVINTIFVLEIIDVIIKNEFCGIIVYIILEKRLYGRKVIIKLF